MKLYGRRMLTREERIANYRISRGRRVVENAYGILVSRLRVMLTTIELPPETVIEVIFTCAVLHNILRSQYQGQHVGQMPGDDDDDDDVPGNCQLIGGAAGGGPDRNHAREAKRQRDYLKDYFVGRRWAIGGRVVILPPLRPGFDPRHGLKWDSW